METVSISAAFVAGVVSFLFPCVLPLVPGYISMLSGTSVEELRQNSRDSRLLASIFRGSIMFVLGFSLVFVLLGASATWVGGFLLSRLPLLAKIAAIIIIVFGLHLMGVFRITPLYRYKGFITTEKPRGLVGSFTMGLAFAFGWTPCIGPILAGILAYAATRETVTQGIVLLSVYSLGLGVPFLLTGLGTNWFMKFYGRFKKGFKVVEIASGTLLVIIGILIFTENFTRLAGYLSFLNRFAL